MANKIGSSDDMMCANQSYCQLMYTCSCAHAFGSLITLQEKYKKVCAAGCHSGSLCLKRQEEHINCCSSMDHR